MDGGEQLRRRLSFLESAATEEEEEFYDHHTNNTYISITSTAGFNAQSSSYGSNTLIIK
jgi:hypothetical protein